MNRFTSESELREVRGDHFRQDRYSWMYEEMTEGQRKWMKLMGMTDEELAGIDKGGASGLIRAMKYRAKQAREMSNGNR